MFDRLKALYDAGRLSEAQLGAAVIRGWISQEQSDQITG